MLAPRSWRPEAAWLVLPPRLSDARQASDVQRSKRNLSGGGFADDSSLLAVVDTPEAWEPWTGPLPRIQERRLVVVVDTEFLLGRPTRCKR
jgi:hypothetical protein